MPDGSLTILIQKDKPADTADWPPAPAGNFNLTFRLYVPETPILGGSYRLPSSAWSDTAFLPADGPGADVSRSANAQGIIDCGHNGERGQLPYACV
jgi:hypothetical protein